MSDSLQPHGPQHSRLPSPTLSPRVCSNCIHWVSDAVQISHALLPLLLPWICPSSRDFSSESAGRIRWPKYWSFSFSISPSNEYSGLSSIEIDWFDLLAIQGTLRSLLQLAVNILDCRHTLKEQQEAEYQFYLRVYRSPPIRGPLYKYLLNEAHAQKLQVLELRLTGFRWHVRSHTPLKHPSPRALTWDSFLY